MHRGALNALEAVDIGIAQLAAKRVGRLAPDHQQLDRLALAAKAHDLVAGLAGDGTVKAATQAAISGHYHQKMGVVLAVTDQKLRCGCRVCLAGKRIDDLLHAVGVGTPLFGGVLSTAQLCRRDHLHGRGDLLRRLHAVDACF